MQNVGRVNGAPLEYSVALRSSPLICAIDTIFILTKFIWMLAIGCSIKGAARHVWYDRFDNSPRYPDNPVDDVLEEALVFLDLKT